MPSVDGHNLSPCRVRLRLAQAQAICQIAHHPNQTVSDRRQALKNRLRTNLMATLIALAIFAAAPLAGVQQSPAAASEGPPHEEGTFREPDLVELKRVDPTIKLDIRYATANNFLGRPVYTEARAFLQRPAA